MWYLAKYIVVWPTTSCFADWSKRRHVTLSIIICSPLHGHPGWHYNVTWGDIIMSPRWPWSGHVTFTKCKRKIYSTSYVLFVCFCFFCHTTKHMTHRRSRAVVWHFQPRVVIFPCPTHYCASSVKCQRQCQCQSKMFNVAGTAELLRSPWRRSRVTELC